MMTCTVAEWLRLLPPAIGSHEFEITTVEAAGSASVQLCNPNSTQTVIASLQIRWHAAPPRHIALVRLPQLCVNFQFAGTHADERLAFMQRFDLFMQRGGG